LDGCRYDQAGDAGESLGWPTNARTRPLMLDELSEAIAEGHLLIHSEGLIDECLTFVTTDSGSREAQSGKHDDRVIAAAIAWQVRNQAKPALRIDRVRSDGVERSSRGEHGSSSVFATFNGRPYRIIGSSSNRPWRFKGDPQPRA